MWLIGCASSPEILIRTEIKEVPVSVQVPLPEELILPCLPAFGLSQSGPMRFAELEGYLEELVRTVGFCNGQIRKIKDLQPPEALPISE